VDTALDTVSRTLAAEGQTPAATDRAANIVTTEWKDTGFRYGMIQGVSATILRRYTVTLAPAGEGSNVTVRIDAKRCQQGGFTIGGTDVRGLCEEQTDLPGSMQKELDALGAKMRTALGAPAAGAAAPAAPAATPAK